MLILKSYGNKERPPERWHSESIKTDGQGSEGRRSVQSLQSLDINTR